MFKEKIIQIVDSYKDELMNLAKKIWDNPETAYNEKYASELQRQYLKSKGFTIKCVEGMETAFIAEYGSNGNIIGLMGEYDALEGQSQKVSVEKECVKEGAAGHGCGHNLLGVGSLGAALAIKEFIKINKIQGIVRYYGCPAEEKISGKVIMAQKGVFENLSCALSWHPFDVNSPFYAESNSVLDVKFRFKGTASHAAQAPQNGRSALDGLELMNVGVNYLREHIIDPIRIHYTITNGGDRPNVVPALAESWYVIRGPKVHNVKDTLNRIINIGKGAALMTETEMEYDIEAAAYDFKPNKELTKVIENNMNLVGAPQYEEEDYNFAEKLVNTMTKEQRLSVLSGFGADKSLVDKVLHDELGAVNMHNIITGGSFDLGDVSYIVPTAQLAVAAWPLGTSAHTWQACAASGHSMGYKAMIVASKVLALAAYDILGDSKVIEKSWKEFKIENNGEKYRSIV